LRAQLELPVLRRAPNWAIVEVLPRSWSRSDGLTANPALVCAQWCSLDQLDRTRTSSGELGILLCRPRLWRSGDAIRSMETMRIRFPARRTQRSHSRSRRGAADTANSWASQIALRNVAPLVNTRRLLASELRLAGCRQARRSGRSAADMMICRATTKQKALAEGVSARPCKPTGPS
jgi:hypothetical protein